MNTPTNTPMTITQAKRQANIFTRAKAMHEQGYRVQQYGITVGYGVFKPENKETKNARADYFVNLTPGQESCACPDFEQHKDTCKHIQFVKLEKERIALDEERWETFFDRMGDAECAMGCDYSDHHF